MEIGHAHGPNEASKTFIQVVNGHATTAWSAGELIELMESPPTGVALGAAWVQHPASETVNPKAMALRSQAAADFTQTGLAQVYGPTTILEFTGTASNRWLVPSGATAGHATVTTLAAPDAGEIAAKVGYCVTAAGTPTTISAFLQML